MNRKLSITLFAVAALCFAGFALAGMSNMDTAPAPAAAPSTQPASAIDLRNTICPVSGDTVGTSNLVEVYNGKVYHLCCSDCHTSFEKDPSKYATAVAADPKKYGVK